MPETAMLRLQKIDAEGDRLIARQNALRRLSTEVGPVAKCEIQSAERAVGEAITALYHAAAIVRPTFTLEEIK